MKDIKDFLSLERLKDSAIFKRLHCSYNEALILRELCENHIRANSSTAVYTLLVSLFKAEKYAYLDHLSELKHLIELGFVVQTYNVFKTNSKEKGSLLGLLQTDVALSEQFLQLLEGGANFDLSQKGAYADFLEYLKDEFERIRGYERLSLLANKELKDELKAFEVHIKARLKKSKFYNIIAEIFKENALNEKEELIFLALLRQEYAMEGENSATSELNSLLNLISTNELERLENKYLLDEGARLYERGLVDYDEYLNAYGDLTKSFFITDEILERIVNFKEPQKSKKIKLETALKEQDIFELIEPSTDINDVIMPTKTKELLQNILKQQDKTVLERLHLWGIKANKNIEAKIIFYGPAGTGKTMSALSLAKSMKKAVLSFDCSKILSKYVGESEQNVRKIFDTYKNIATNCKQSPILLLNEADQFLSTRTENSAGADKMHNQMQNIFLEQIEKFSGVIIATTNFLESLDTAFSRRFEYKIEFKKPDYKDRLLIWQKALPKNASFDDEFSVENVANYELSGAQIMMVVKNTALKAAISKDGVFKMKDFLESIQKELNSSFDNAKIVGFGA
ncbi:ATP-binding protein [Campylobacter troglodytis]|uniref:ATP-binding protein n=1 Tax=Campylobacter troglodytis TaxID=654363 RepID=UPI0011573208|nr:ATP-binding protein [Campylobacter troglodytis]TQR60946.1 AAA family ATPase [Campylobacter troglodytis]